MDQSLQRGGSADEAAPVDVTVPATGGRRRRIAGWLVDYLVVMVPGLVVVGLLAIHVVNSLPGYVGAVAASAGWSRLTYLFAHHDATGIRQVAGSEWLDFALPLIIGLLAVPALQFVYLAGLLTWRGRTLGMMVVDVTAGTGPARARLRSGRAAVRAALIVLVETGVVSVALVLMLTGEFFLGAMAWAAAVALFWLDVLVALAPAKRTLIDRLTGTVVVRRGLYTVIARQSTGLARRASGAAIAVGITTADVAMSAGQTLASAATTAGQAVADAAAITGDLARQGAQRIVHSAQVQSVLESRAGQQAQAISAAGVDRARELGDLTGERAREFGGRVRDLWQGRRTARAGDAASPAGPVPALPGDPAEPAQLSDDNPG